MDCHPQEFQKEQQHLAHTLALIAGERKKAQEALGMEGDADRLVQVADDASSEAVVQQFVLQGQLRTLRQLRLAEKSPYFARVDFTPAPEGRTPLVGGLAPGKKTPVYIGRWGVLKTPEYRMLVADWRSPVANLYYSGQVGPVAYLAPDGPVKGQVSLKRVFTLEEGRLVAMQDTGLMGQEAFLAQALSQLTTDKLREVVPTIQAEQNLIIRFDPQKPLCVQGVAGSGKTTIALHRVAWLLYRLQKTLQPSQVMILAPNPLFLHYISQVLPDLGVEAVRQTTFPRLAALLLGRRMPRLDKTDRLAQRLRMTQPQQQALDDILLQKGSLALAPALDHYLDRLEKALLPAQDIAFVGRVLLSRQEVEDLFLRQLRHFPLEARIREVDKVVQARLDKLTNALEAALHRATDQKLDALLQAMPEGPDRQAKATRLLESRTQRLSEMEQAVQAFWQTYRASWGSLDLLPLYQGFWQEAAAQSPGLTPLWQATKPLLEKGLAALEDVPALLWLGKRLYGYPPQDIRHLVIDEAQDTPPLQVLFLRQLVGHDAFTLVGDLCQGIYGAQGIRRWEDLSQGLFSTPPHLATLSTSYRSTVEITALALHILARHPVEGILPGQPILRHGPLPLLLRPAQPSGRASAVAAQVQAWQKEGFQSLAVIVKQEEEAQRLYRQLLPLLPEVRLIRRGDEALQGGIQVLGAALVKGLEFDGVILPDVDNATYPDQPFYARLLYMLCTRPLHRLALITPQGQACSLLEGAPVKEGE